MSRRAVFARRAAASDDAADHEREEGEREGRDGADVRLAAVALVRRAANVLVAAAPRVGPVVLFIVVVVGETAPVLRLVLRLPEAPPGSTAAARATLRARAEPVVVVGAARMRITVII